MKISKKIISRIGLLVGLLFSFCFMAEAKAVKCGDILSYQDQNSVAYACGKVEQYPWEARGTLWLNDSSDEYDTESWVHVSAAQMKAGGKVRIYLHGAILNSSGAYATNIKLVKVNSTIWGNAYDYSNYSPLSNVPSTMWRVGNPYPFDYHIKASVSNQVILDAKKLLALEKGGSNCNTSGNTTTCKIRLEAFRCYQGRTPQSSSCYDDGSCSCYSDKSFLNVVIEEPVATFKGLSSVSGNGASKSTGYVDVDKRTDNLIVMMNQSEKESGRPVDYKLSLKASDVSGKTNYQIYKWTKDLNAPWNPDPNKEWTKEKITNGTATVTYDKTTDFPYSIRIKPNEVVCYSLTFNKKSSGGNATTVMSCAVGSLIPDYSDWKRLDAKVRNRHASAQYNNWKDDYVYAKPGDDVEFAGEYRPDMQNYASFTGKMFLDDWSKRNSSFCKYNDCSKSVARLIYSGANGRAQFVDIPKNNNLRWAYDSVNSYHWNNAFTVYLDDNHYKNIFGVVGSNDAYNNYDEDETYKYTILSSDVGKKKEARALLNQNSETMNTPRNIRIHGGYDNPNSVEIEVATGNKTTCTEEDITKCYDYGVFWDDRYYFDAASEKVYAVVPYNFNTRATISNVGGVVYAGEVKNIPFGAEVLNKANVLTTQHGTESEAYATVVPETRCGLEVSYDRVHWSLVEERDGGSISASNNGSYSADLPIADAQSGSKIYLRSYVSPATSGSDDNLSVDGFTGTAYSEIIELHIAKKPNFQVWGGSVYSNGNIDLGKYVSKSAVSDDDAYVFGSWTELSLQVNGTVKGLASGAGLGYTKDGSGNIFPSPYGNFVDTGNYKSIGGGKNDICYTNTLSFKNDECADNKLGSSGISLTSKDNLISMLNKINDDTVDMIGLDMDCAEKTCDLSGGTLKAGVKVFNVSDSDLTITGNMYYGDEENHVLDSANLPKLFIYAKNITIDCGVEEINAVLIADGYVDTCKTEARDGYDEDHKYNHPSNSHQLKINGSVIANKLKLNRTYGAGSGINSIVPAEIINYDPTLYVWSDKGGGDDGRVGGGELEPGSYLKEVAPRY